jgi:hypothetical protein
MGYDKKRSSKNIKDKGGEKPGFLAAPQKRTVSSIEGELILYRR